MKTKHDLLILIAYLLMIIIWSTTPLAIKWSSQGVDFITGLSVRMLIGAILATTLALFWYKKFPLDKKARQVYWASAAAIYGAMMLVYWGAQYIPSGLVSVLYGLTPIATTGFAVYLLSDESLNLSKTLGVFTGILGLSVIFIDQLSIGEQAAFGIGAVLCSVLLHSASAVWIKRLKTPLPALIVTAGGLSFSLPLFMLTIVLFADPLPEQIPARALWSIIYLGVMGSVVGFVSYYYALEKLSPSTVALATLITPITALLLGRWLNQEAITLTIFLGSALVMTGLVIHQWYDKLINKLTQGE